MKLRIRGNSLRIRLTKSEISRLQDGAKVEETISFATEQKLIYEIIPESRSPRASSKLSSFANFRGGARPRP